MLLGLRAAGDVVTGSTVQNSHYYQFTLQPDDAGVAVRLTQSQAGTRDNYIDVVTPLITLPNYLIS